MSKSKSGQRLFWQLSAAFAAIVLVLGGGMFLLGRLAWEELGPAVEGGSLAMYACVEKLADYHAVHGSWEGAASVFEARPCRRGWSSGERGPHARDVLLLADDVGIVVAARGAERVGEPLTADEAAQALPIVSANRVVGFLYSDQAGAFESRFVAGLLWMGGTLVGLSLVTGVLLSRRISSPIVALTEASRAMAAGDLDARVDVRGRGEVRELAIAFNQMAEQVAGTVETLRHFVSDAAHEINTPLTALRTHLELAPQDANVREALIQARRLETLAAGLLDLSRIEAGAAVGSHDVVALSALLAEVSEVYASRAEQAGLDFLLSLTEAPVLVRGDAAQLRRAMGNVLDNAVKFTPEGGRVTLALEEEGVEAVVTVTDTGIGIPEADLPQIFGRFHRGRNTHAFPGNGLGLAIVKAIVTGHGGRVHLEHGTPGTRVVLRFGTCGRQDPR